MRNRYRVCCGIGIGLLGMLLVPAGAAEIYKWRDEQGNVIYSQNPPPGDVDAETITPPPDVETEKALLRLRKQKQQGSEYDKEHQAREKEEQAKAKQVAQRKENCQRGREMLKSFNTRPTVQLTQDDGTLVRATEEQRQAYITQANAMIKEFCD